MRHKNDKKYRFLWGFVFSTVVFYILFDLFPFTVETFYGRGLYKGIRVVFDKSFGLINFPFVYLVVSGWAALFLVWVSNGASWTRKMYTMIVGLLTVLALFFWLWGFNYMRPSVKQKLDLHIPDVDKSQLWEFYCELIEEMPIWRDTLTLRPYEELEREVRNNAERGFNYLNLPSPGSPRVRCLLPKGVLLGTSTAGIYIPYAVEAHFDGGLHPLTWPYVMSHEISHAFGVTDEGECNFLASILCQLSSQADMKYSGAIHDLRYVFSALLRSGEDIHHLRAQIPVVIKDDLKAIQVKHDEYPHYIPENIRNWIYDSYLKSQGVKSGLSSYGEVLGLLIAWRARE